MHDLKNSGIFLIFAIASLSYCAYYWFSDIIDEATFSGYHTRVVRKSLRIGFGLFIVSEIMLFFGLFWAFGHSSVVPTVDIGYIYPPEYIVPVEWKDFPAYNTLILITSGLSITWTHKSIALNSVRKIIDGFLITIILGIYFVLLQVFEYYETTFSFSDSIHGCTFFMLTGLHGSHVIAGITFLLVCFIRFTRRHYLRNHYSGLILAIWYWHFVDIVWILLFFTVYIWGGWRP
jgi:heme/copper-type cytochrome/quinol oxidase subunit 3